LRRLANCLVFASLDPIKGVSPPRTSDGSGAAMTIVVSRRVLNDG
jgi:hypothetical protein